nr:MAG TPA: hypothetical protein [Caudoviricetes sp.]
MRVNELVYHTMLYTLPICFQILFLVFSYQHLQRCSIAQQHR